MEKTVLSVRNLRKVYGDLVAVDDVSFTVGRGEVFGLLGPNGAGKTTILECLEGIRQPDGGTLAVMGVDPGREPRKLRNLVGVQLQSAGLPAAMTVREAMRFFCAYHRVDPRYDLLERLGLHDRHRAQYQELSTGQQRRLALALAMAHRPPVIFLDEPTAGLDVGSRAELHALMQELQGDGTTLIMATHDMAEAEKMTDRVAILLRGRIVATGSPAELIATGRGTTKVSVRSQQASLSYHERVFPGVSQRLANEDYVIFFSTDPGPTVSAILSYLEGRDDRLIDLRVERPSLEERFLELTTREGAE